MRAVFLAGGAAVRTGRVMLGWVSMLRSWLAVGESGPVVVLAGEADAQSAGPLRELLVSQVWRGERRLAVDVSGLHGAAPEPLRVLVVAAQLLRERGGDLVLLRPRAAVARMLDVLGAGQVITVVDPPEG